MKADDLDFPFPEELIATEPARPSRVAFVNARGEPKETNLAGLLEQFMPGDLLVINESKVIPARVFSTDEVEILFLRPLDDSQTWEVLFPAREFAVGDCLKLPQNLELTLLAKGLPQKVKLSRAIDTTYFEAVGEVALPPYIQERRGERHNRTIDREWYQTEWAKRSGSVAAPTASLHFQNQHLEQLKARSVNVAQVTLHVGAGTFLPIKARDLKEHVMHAEYAEISAETARAIAETKERGGKIWALGTTVARTLESMAQGLLAQKDGVHFGETKLFIYPPYEFKIVDVLLTNFHQPRSTLLGLVAAFAGLEKTKNVYSWAIERRFRLFSYGDLSAWIKP